MTTSSRRRADIPRIPSDVIARPRLAALLDNTAALTLLRGASGSGKTVALATWARDTDHDVVWLTASPEIGSTEAFATALLRALARHDIGHSAEDPPRTWAAVAEALRDVGRPTVIVIDDAAFLHDDTAFDLCRAVLEAPRVRLVAAVNRRSPFDSDGVDLLLDRAVIAPGDLGFDSSEIARALSVDETVAAGIRTATGGFPALIHAAAKRRLAHDPDTLLETAADAVGDYLRARIAHSRIDPAVVGDLAVLSVVPSIDAVTACTLTGNPGMAAVLEEAALLGIGSWTASAERVFAFTPLARLLLGRQLDGSEADRVRAVQRAGVDAALAGDRPVEALRLAVEIDDLSLASHVVMRSWYELLDHHGRDVIDTLGRLPLSRLRDHALLSMLLAICYLATRLRRLRGLQLLRVAIAAANSRTTSLAATDRIFILSAESVALRLIGMHDRAAHVATRALRIVADTPEQEWEAYAVQIASLCTQLGVSLYYGGRTASAIECLEHAASLAAAHRMHNSFHAISMLSGIHALDGDMPEAEHYAEIIRAGDWEAGYLDGYRGTFYRIAEALLAIERGDVRAAAAQVRVFLPHRATSEHWAAMASAEAWVSLHAGEADAGLERLESLARLRGREATSPAARHTLSRPRALLHTALGDVAAAKQVLQRDGNADRFATAVERARVALVDGRPADAVRILDRHRGGPENARQRADAAAIRAAAVARSAGDPAARASIASLRLVLDDRELRTPAVLLDQDDADAVTGLLRDAGLTIPSAVRSPFPRRSAVPRLSARERVVLDALTTGQSLRAIAEELHVSQNTLKTQLRGLYRKLGAANRADALEKAAAAGLLTRR